MPYDFDDELSVYAAERRARLARLQEEADRRKAIEEEQERIAREKSTARTIGYTRRHVLAEYQRAGVSPPASIIGTDGFPTVSLTFLIKSGWSIESLGDRNLLIAPPAQPERPRKTREDYQNVEGS